LKLYRPSFIDNQEVTEEREREREREKSLREREREFIV
jgi:hypothetical protein